MELLPPIATRPPAPPIASVPAIGDGNFKLVIHEQKQGAPEQELFDLQEAFAERTNLTEQHPAIATKLQTEMRHWQESVLRSLTGADYEK